ncbi:signal peptidase [Burkholderia gladioli]|jgi:uncharacterized protein YbjQ (UPF0145 family)|uniref:heavy metal-binding domain-containing protein n=1 Tax=Burkholderia TaxID=32008 RepID=UPI000756291A|nr:MULTISPECIES: heavy metal-binding domain-containing protein [Burkholderia]KVM73384.1 signal peptidase [Burkholderia gladioli]NIF71811.1 heavy metal-binding domain-containing protein [Burkholderia sp. Ap-962]
MKHQRHLAGIVLASLLLAGCGTVVRSLPLPDSAAADVGGVKLYFGAQAHPAVKTSFGQRSSSARVARGSSIEQQACEQALAQALDRLRDDAKRRGGNAVINVTTRFHETRSDSQTHFTCGVSGSAGAIAVAGEVVLLDAQ